MRASTDSQSAAIGANQERKRYYIYAIRGIWDRGSFYLTLICRCGVAHLQIPSRPAVVALRMRRPYKLFGFEMNVSRRKKGNRQVTGDVHILLAATLRLKYVDTRPTNDILTQLGHRGMGCPVNVSPANISRPPAHVYSYSRVVGTGGGSCF